MRILQPHIRLHFTRVYLVRPNIQPLIPTPLTPMKMSRTRIKIPLGRVTTRRLPPPPTYSFPRALKPSSFCL